MQITRNIYVETGYFGANVGYICTDQGLVMVDTPQKPSDAIVWKKEIEAKGSVKYLINTEPHMDHVTGNYFFNTTIIAQEKTRKAILDLNITQIQQRTAEIDPPGLQLIKEYFINVPTITFSDRLTLYLGSHTIYLIHLPGQTTGETAVFIPEERLIFSGDNVFYKLQAFLHQADPFDWLKSLKRLGELDADYIVPGHGEVCNKGYLREQAEFIQDWIETVRKAIKSGWTKEEALARISLLDRYPMLSGEPDWMGPELQRWNISRLYDLLSQDREPHFTH